MTVFATTIVGVALAFFAWWGASGTGKLDRQVAWTVAAVIGLIVLGFGNFTWLLKGRRAVALRRTRLVEEVERRVAHVDTTSDATSGPMVVHVAGSERFHDGNCQLVRGKGVRVLTSVDGLRPCEMCEPHREVVMAATVGREA